METKCNVLLVSQLFMCFMFHPMYIHTAEADTMLAKEGTMLAMPGPPLSVDLIDAERNKKK